jgi:poly-gamma-glutamate synthesis protein (capsule biosynthesis protein)
MRDWPRRRFLGLAVAAALGGRARLGTVSAVPAAADGLTLFLCGDMMTGRGIDQILPHPGDPQLREPYARDAREYVALAEDANGAVARPVDFSYVWGDALAELRAMAPDLRIVNLETAVTARGERWKKGIHYRMHPRNLPCLAAAAIDCCVLANNHVLDWGHAGLEDTVAALERAGIRHAGAGRDAAAAAAPALLEASGKGRVAVFSCALQSSGVDPDWAAATRRAGVNYLPDLDAAGVAAIAAAAGRIRQPRDIIVVSLHWGGNWGYAVPAQQRAFAHALIDEAGVDVVHGHSSHHVKGIEVYRERPILYGCGDFLNDYEGIGGYEDYRGELGLMYFPRLDPAGGRLLSFTLSPTRIRRLRVNRAAPDEARWLADVLNREGMTLGTRAVLNDDGRLELRW